MNERERTPASRAPFFLFPINAPERTPYKEMIRLFKELCKTLLENLTDEEIFLKATDDYNHHSERCPRCGVRGRLSPHGIYSRQLVSYENGMVLDQRISLQRFECNSCYSTHALHPDILIPFSPYSLRFKLTVLIAYFERDTTVASICNHFCIAVSTLYEWKKGLLEHKDLLFSILINRNRNKSAVAFIYGLLGSTRLSGILGDFFHRYDFSFLQSRPPTATRGRPP